MTWPGTDPTGSSSCSADRTTRSRSGAGGSSRARSRPPCCGPGGCQGGAGRGLGGRRPVAATSSPTSSPPVDVAPDLGGSRRAAAARCPTTSCRARSCRSTRCRSTRTARSTARRLPAPDAAGARRRRDRAAARPRSRASWPRSGSELLGVASRSASTDNFFALGGDSIKSIQAVAGCRAPRSDGDARQMFQPRPSPSWPGSPRARPDGAQTRIGVPPRWSPRNWSGRLRRRHPRSRGRTRSAHAAPDARGWRTSRTSPGCTSSRPTTCSGPTAWTSTVARGVAVRRGPHPTLRTSFHWEGLAEPVAVVHSRGRGPGRDARPAWGVGRPEQVRLAGRHRRGRPSGAASTWAGPVAATAPRASGRRRLQVHVHQPPHRPRRLVAGDRPAGGLRGLRDAARGDRPAGAARPAVQGLPVRGCAGGTWPAAEDVLASTTSTGSAARRPWSGPRSA